MATAAATAATAGEWVQAVCAWKKSFKRPAEVVEGVVKASLAEHGFGFPSEIMINCVLEKKLGVKLPFHKIIGACHAPSANRGLAAEPLISTLLPCNVTVRDCGNGETEVAMVDAKAMMSMFPGNKDLEEVGLEVAGLLEATRNDISQKLA